jgi:hypothetical protein
MASGLLLQYVLWIFLSPKHGLIDLIAHFPGRNDGLQPKFLCVEEGKHGNVICLLLLNAGFEILRTWRKWKHRLQDHSLLGEFDSPTNII